VYIIFVHRFVFVETLDYNISLSSVLDTT